MKVKEEKKLEFVEAMSGLVRAIKNETDNCGKLCGGANEKELYVIVYIGENKNVKMTEIADHLESPMSTLTSIVDKLVDKGLIIRDHSAEDRRVVNVSLSEKGKEAYKLIATKKKKVAQSMLGKLSEKDQDLMISFLKELAGTIGAPQ
jgi:DNA-binding MarR family transcriptional regulator